MKSLNAGDMQGEKLRGSICYSSNNDFAHGLHSWLLHFIFQCLSVAENII